MMTDSSSSPSGIPGWKTTTKSQHIIVSLSAFTFAAPHSYLATGRTYTRTLLVGSAKWREGFHSAGGHPSFCYGSPRLKALWHPTVSPPPPPPPLLVSSSKFQPSSPLPLHLRFIPNPYQPPRVIPRPPSSDPCGSVMPPQNWRRAPRTGGRIEMSGFLSPESSPLPGRPLNFGVGLPWEPPLGRDPIPW